MAAITDDPEELGFLRDLQEQQQLDDAESTDEEDTPRPARKAMPGRRRMLVKGAVSVIGVSMALALVHYATRVPVPRSVSAVAEATGAAETKEEVASKDDEDEEDEKKKPVFKKCLCVFDIDRTLTGKQGWAGKCGKDTELGGVPDEAYAKGTLLVSELAQSVGSTFCGECYHGIVTAGKASGPNSAERQKLLKYLGGTARTRTDFWQDISFKADTPVVTSLVVQALDGSKQKSVASMVEWWRNKQHIDIKPEDVYFFDDIKENVEPFRGTGFNAQQVSCASRGPAEKLPGAYDGKIGGCGGAFKDLKKKKGVFLCGEVESS
mmetsp:Transcript_55438/g.124901  ORF Transcript_55438/g.124901 Transcript_55438/m.124901 type:complete len:322 (+) Transcript_55438:67-1032(+)